MMLLPKYSAYEVRLRMARLAPNEDFVLLYPLENVKGYDRPTTMIEEFTEMELLTKGPGGDTLIEMMVDAVTGALNSNPMAWCAHGAVIRFERLPAALYRVTIKPHVADPDASIAL